MDSYWFASLSSNVNNFPNQLLPPGHTSSDIRRAEFVMNPDLLMRNAAQRQLEKERIREEIIAEEIMRRKELELEVRRELEMERELAIRRLEGLSLPGSSSVEGRMPFPACAQVGCFGHLPFQRNPMVADCGNKPAGKVVFFAKPTSPSIPVSNRKVAAVGESKAAMTSSKKKPIKEWGCALCKVSAPCEQALNDHLHGKKHKEKVAELRANKAANKKTGSSSLVDKKTNGAIRPTNNTGNLKSKHGKKQLTCALCQVSASSEQSLKEHLQGRNHKAKEAEQKANKTTENHSGSCSVWKKKTDKKDAKPMKEDVDTACEQGVNDHLQGKNNKAKEAEQLANRNTDNRSGSHAIWQKKTDQQEAKPVTEEANKKQSNFWCQDCHVQCNSETDMASHLKGKKHMAELEAQNQNLATDTFVGLIVTSEKGVGSKATYEEVMENVDGKVHTLKEADAEAIKVLDSPIDKEAGAETTEALKKMTDKSIQLANSNGIPRPGRKLEEQLPAEDLRKLFKFWCNDCQIGFHSETDVASHQKGKKHMTQPHALVKNVSTVSFGTIQNDGNSENGGDGSVSKCGEAVEIIDGRVYPVDEALDEVIKALDLPLDIEAGEASKTLEKKTDKTINHTSLTGVPGPEHGEKKEEKLTLEELKKKFEFWCEYCQIGCHSEVVMSDHRKGKKHMTRLRAWKENCASVSSAATPDGDTFGIEDASDERFEEALEDFDGEVDNVEEAKDEEGATLADNLIIGSSKSLG